MVEVMTGATLRNWMEHAVQLLGERREEIDRLNVFPVPDGDTGTNLYLTIEAAAAAVTDAAEAGVESVSDTIARGALLGARGNSGVIISQIFRGFADGVAEFGGDEIDGHTLTRALAHAADSAYAAVAIPKEGTVLSVARGAAMGAATSIGDVSAVTAAALQSAREALARTPEQLPVLAEAGVVDAGGRGLVVILDALHRAVEGLTASVGAIHRATVEAPLGHTPTVGYDGPEYEVMYLLDAEDDQVPGLRAELDAIGDSVVVVGGKGLWNIHVHTDDIGPAIERAVDIGRPYRIRVTRLLEADSLRVRGRGEATTRALVVVTHGPGMSAYLTEAGATVVPAPPKGRPSTSELLAGASQTGAQDVVFLPSDRDTRPVAEAAAAAARDLGVRASVVPTNSIVQSLAAVAVHDAGARFDDDVIAMGRAAGAARYGGVTVAARQASTPAGTCQIGDVLGLVDGDIAVIGTELVAAAGAVVDKLMSANCELVTVVVGRDATDAMVDSLVEQITAAHPDVEVDVLPGGQPSWPFILGAE